MLCIHLTEKDPYFCLAAEEFLLKNYGDDIFMVWQSYDTVVVGKHQNAMGEINYRHVREKGIGVARRISGGGTVFHDRGNVNFTYIKNVAGAHEVSFKRFTEPVRGALAQMGVIAETSGRNDLLVEGRKISGNAEHIFRNRVLHHGTLLFSSDLANLGEAIRVVPGRYSGKAVPSIPSTVANISEFLPHPMTPGEFIGKLLDYQLSGDPDNRMYALPEQEIAKIRKLAVEKFASREWQFGYSPAYTFCRHANPEGFKLDISLSVEKGRIVMAQIAGNYYGPEEGVLLEQELAGRFHAFEEVKEAHAVLRLYEDENLIYCYF
ncbi:MAG TPA: lipoate--protein ligase [Prolixibacteraceae bacterium]|nr:lipoate--protein ligase [Prolixibacteraceae bacterium]